MVIKGPFAPSDNLPSLQDDPGSEKNSYNSILRPTSGSSERPHVAPIRPMSVHIDQAESPKTSSRPTLDPKKTVSKMTRPKYPAGLKARRKTDDELSPSQRCQDWHYGLIVGNESESISRSAKKEAIHTEEEVPKLVLTAECEIQRYNYSKEY